MATFLNRLQDRHVILILQCILAAVILFVLYLISLHNYLLFHSVVEMIGIAIAFSIFILVWNTRKLLPDAFFLIIGISLLFTGSLDLLHTLAYKGMGIFVENSADLPTQLWIAARYFQSIALLIATFFIGKSITKDRNLDANIIFVTCATVFCLLLTSIFFWQNFPHSFIDGTGLTPFKIVSEYIISLILAATVIMIILKRQYFDSLVWKLLISSLIFLILGELAFTSYVSVYGFMNMLGHLFRLVSVYLFYRAIVVVGLTRPYDLLFRDLKQNQEALQTLAADLRAIIDNAPAMIWYKDTKNNFIRVNPAGARAFGMPIDKIEGKSSHDLFPDLADKYYQDDLEVIRSGNPRLGIIELMTNASGEHLWVQTDKIPLKDSEGNVTGVLLFVTDITDRKHVGDALALANRKLNLLSSITRHDILNQLTVLKGYIELLKMEQPDPAFSTYFNNITGAADRILEMIQFTKTYEDIGHNAPAWQDCSKLVDTVAMEIPPGKVIMKNDLPGGLEVFADPLIVKVFYNLLDNALRYGRKITTIRFSEHESGDKLLIVCEDDGDGIPAAEKEKIFERGFGKNTGMGLFLAREILDITGITIIETGEPGRGARFEIAVPKGAFRYRS